MVRAEAITRIQDGLGFATRQEAKIILRLQEAQRELEKGKTLPRFLLQETQPLTLVAATRSVALPAGFLRIDDDFKPFFVTSGNILPTYINVIRSVSDASDNFTGESSDPKVMTVRKATVDFINVADTNYTVYWQYYKAAALLSSDVENEWLANAPEWLIGEAGWRMAMDARDKDATALFDMMRKTGRAATFGEVIAFEESSGPLIMGANL